MTIFILLLCWSQAWPVGTPSSLFLTPTPYLLPLNPSFLCGPTGHSRHIWSLPRPSSGTRHFSKEPAFLLEENGIWKPRSGDQVCSLLLGLQFLGPLGRRSSETHPTHHTPRRLFLLKNKFMPKGPHRR